MNQYTEMTLEILLTRISLPAEAWETALNSAYPSKQLEQLTQLYRSDRKAFFSQLKQLNDYPQLTLYLYAHFALDTYKLYVQNKIDDQIYFDTLSDITIWSKNHFQKTGCWGIKEVEWISLSINLKLFRLGRLQFEPMSLPHNISFSETELLEGIPILNVHIPEGMSLNPEFCEESFKKAYQFFDTKFNYYLCESWLLSPNLSTILSADSNIMQFQSFFEITSTVYFFRQAEERVFGEILEDKKQYTAKTSLQQKLKSYVCEGHDPGIGIGIRPRVI